MTNDIISENVEISKKLHIECPACGADVVRDFEWINYADYIYVDCPYCKLKFTVKINWIRSGGAF